MCFQIHDYEINDLTKNKTVAFKNATSEIEQEIERKNTNSSENKTIGKISLKNVPIDELLGTFDDNKTVLQNLFEERRNKLDRFNYGNGFDFLTVLPRVLDEEQKKMMYQQICTAFMENFEKYIGNPLVSKEAI